MFMIFQVIIGSCCIVVTRARIIATLIN